MQASASEWVEVDDDDDDEDDDDDGEDGEDGEEEEEEEEGIWGKKEEEVEVRAAITKFGMSVESFFWFCLFLYFLYYLVCISF